MKQPVDPESRSVVRFSIYFLRDRERMARLGFVSIFIEPLVHYNLTPATYRRLTGDFRSSLTSKKPASGKKATPHKRLHGYLRFIIAIFSH